MTDNYDIEQLVKHTLKYFKAEMNVLRVMQYHSAYNYLKDQLTERVNNTVRCLEETIDPPHLRREYHSRIAKELNALKLIHKIP